MVSRAICAWAVRNGLPAVQSEGSEAQGWEGDSYIPYKLLCACCFPIPQAAGLPQVMGIVQGKGVCDLLSSGNKPQRRTN